MLIGYARVSTEDQNLVLQLVALKKASCKRIFTDKISAIRKTFKMHMALLKRDVTKTEVFGTQYRPWKLRST
jgi:DNA invertase Pin-like site-specific DNA recombinase